MLANGSRPLRRQAQGGNKSLLGEAWKSAKRHVGAMAAMDAGSASGAALAWEPRLNGVPAGVQREIRRGIVSDLGVPPAWVAPTGQGLPQ